VCPDFLPNSNLASRRPLREKLERMDMLKRRDAIDIPEFYVGSIMAVSVSDRYAANRTNRFVGICIQREYAGLKHFFILRNVIDGLGFEVKYDIYNPLIQKIEVLKLEKRIDEHLLYLRDALPEYSTFPLDMEPLPHTPGTPVPLNTMKVRLKPDRWHQRWDIKLELRGIEDLQDSIDNFDRWRRRQRRNTLKVYDHWSQYDLMKIYRNEVHDEDQNRIFQEMIEHENQASKSLRRGRRRWSFMAESSKSSS